jgi:hypothetical protein
MAASLLLGNSSDVLQRGVRNERQGRPDRTLGDRSQPGQNFSSTVYKRLIRITTAKQNKLSLAY